MIDKRFKALLRRDLFSLVLNPAARLSGIFFTLFCFINFFIFARFFVPLAGSTDMRTFFAPMPFLSIVCIPALTVSLWTSYERSAVLPLCASMRILSKWLSALVFISFFLLVSSAVPLAASFFGRVEYSVVLTGFFGILSVFSALIALGLFVSLVFRSKALSFSLSALLFALFSFVHLGSSFSTSSTVQELLRFLSFSRHFDAAGKGIIDSRGFLFFACFTFLFLSLSAFVVEYGRYSAYSKSPYKKALTVKYAALFIFALLCLWNSRIFYFRIDVTSDKRYSLCDVSKRAFSFLENPLTISYYLSPELESAYPAIGEVKEFLYNYADLSKTVAVRTVRVKSEEDKKEAQNAGIFPEVLDKELLFGTRYEEGEGREALVVYSGIVLEYEDKSVPIPFVLTPFNVEFNIADALPLLTASEKLERPRRSVQLIAANYTSLDGEYPYLVPWLEGAGFSVNVIPMIERDELFSRMDMPLIIIGSSLLDEAQCEIIDDFSASGGSILCAVSAHEADLERWKLSPLGSDPFLRLLKKRGISILPPIVADERCARIRLLRQQSGGMQSGDVEAYEEIAYPCFVKIGAEYALKTHPVTASFGGLDLFWPSYMETEHRVLAHTSDRSYVQYPEYRTDPLSAADFIPEKRQSFPAVCAVEPEDYDFSFAGGRMIVVPDEYFLSRMVEYTNAMYNFDFAVNALLWLAGEEDLLSIKNRAFSDYRVKASNSGEFARKARTTLILLFAWFCAVFAAAFIVLCFYRKKCRFEG
ncbi:Gldg family protein [Treponema sp. HNW]|uniref:Gldg family protein n=1 Tax=Treponema sp. HNW TaxID=3116654 RepID=UPI003D14CFBC